MPEQPGHFDFEIQLERTAEGGYTVRVSGLGGRAEARLDAPFTADQRTIIRQALTNAALRSSARVRSASTEEVKQMKEFGGVLFDQVFRDDVKDYYYKCWGQAVQQGKGLRLRLTVDPSLGDLPWEFLCADREFIGLNPQTPIVRFIEQPTPVAPIKAELPLELLVVIASPGDQVTLDTAAEKNRIAAALQQLQDQGLLRVTYLEGHNTLPRLSDALRPDAVHILHFIGHGAFDEKRGEGVLLMEDSMGDTKYVGSEQLKVLMLGKRRLRLVMLNSCLGTAASASEPFSSVAAGLVRAGVPAVIAMQFEVSDRAARVFAETFYESLAMNFPVDAALTEARREIAVTERDSLEWATPVLYMQVADGQLFDLSQKPPDKRLSTDTILAEKILKKADEAFDRQEWDRAGNYYTVLLNQKPDNEHAARRIALIEKLKQKTTPGPITPVQPPPATAQSAATMDTTTLRPCPHCGKTVPQTQARFCPHCGKPMASPVVAPPGAALDLNSKAAERYRVGEEAAAQGRWKDAAPAYRGALMLVPNYGDAAQKAAYCEQQDRCTTLFDQAQRRYETGSYAAALTALNQLRNVNPAWPGLADLQALCDCGQIYQQALTALKTGNRERGADLLRIVLGKRPGFLDTAQRLENLAEGGDGLLGQGAAAAQKETVAYRLYELPGAQLRALADELRQYFVREGYQSQVVEQGATVVVQGQREDALRNLLGMSNAATMVLEPTAAGFKASIGGGKWLDKAGAAALGLLLGFTLLTAGIGAYQQTALEGSLWKIIDEHVTAHGGKKMPLVQ